MRQAARATFTSYARECLSSPRREGHLRPRTSLRFPCAYQKICQLISAPHSCVMTVHRCQSVTCVAVPNSLYSTAHQSRVYLTSFILGKSSRMWNRQTVQINWGKGSFLLSRQTWVGPKDTSIDSWDRNKSISLRRPRAFTGGRSATNTSIPLQGSLHQTPNEIYNRLCPPIPCAMITRSKSANENHLFSTTVVVHPSKFAVSINIASAPSTPLSRSSA